MKKIISMVLIASIGIICPMDRPSQGTNFSTLPEELKTIEIIKANIATAKDAIEAIKNLKKLTLTSKADKNRIEKYIQGHIDEVCQWLNAKTGALERSLYLLEVAKLITPEQAEQVKKKFPANMTSDYTVFFIEFKSYIDGSSAGIQKFIQRLDQRIKKGFNINAKDKKGPLLIDVASPNRLHTKVANAVVVLRYLLTVPFIDVNIKDAAGDTALANAIRGGQTQIVKILIADPRVNLEKITSSGEDALELARNISEKIHPSDAREIISMIKEEMNHRKVDAFIESLKPYAKKK